MKFHVYHHVFFENSCELEKLRKENEELKKLMDAWLVKLDQIIVNLETVSERVDSESK